MQMVTVKPSCVNEAHELPPALGPAACAPRHQNTAVWEIPTAAVAKNRTKTARFRQSGMSPSCKRGTKTAGHKQCA